MPYLTVAEAAVRLGVSEPTVRRWIRAGRLAGERVAGSGGRQYLVSLEGVESAQPAGGVAEVPRPGDPQVIALAVFRLAEPREVCGYALDGQVAPPRIMALATALEQERRQAEGRGADLCEWLASRLPEAEKARLVRGARLWERLAQGHSSCTPLGAE